MCIFSLEGHGFCVQVQVLQCCVRLLSQLWCSDAAQPGALEVKALVQLQLCVEAIAHDHKVHLQCIKQKQQQQSCVLEQLREYEHQVEQVSRSATQAHTWQLCAEAVEGMQASG